MVIKSAEFVKSSTQLSQCPAPNKPEFAFIGRSNVGKSSLINMLVNKKSLAKTSNTPGKTQTINHFIINGGWYLVDLPGYGFAKVSQTDKYEWSKMIEQYMLGRENLSCVFILLDSRLEPQVKDLDFVHWLGSKGVPIALVLTKADKLSRNDLAASVQRYENTLLKTWESLPPFFISSAESKLGKDDVLEFIDSTVKSSAKSRA